MIDILYLAKGRPEFTAASLAALKANTDWSKVRAVWVFTDGADDLPSFGGLVNCVRDGRVHGGPVAIMNHYLSGPGAEIFAKIDNDCIVPPGWLDQSLAVMEAHPELALLGIEPPASRTPAPWTRKNRSPHPESGWCAKCVPYPFGFSRDALMRCDKCGRKDGLDKFHTCAGGMHCDDCVFELRRPGYAPCDSIGGIGLMRRSAFRNRRPMEPHAQNGVGGFTDWQLHFADVCKGWIVPPLKCFLLDRLPFEPWASLSKKYI